MSVTAALTAQNTFTDWIAPRKLHSDTADGHGRLSLSVYGTWAGTITVQRRFGETTTGALVYTSVLDVEGYTANTEKLIDEYDSRAQYRVGFKTSEYTSGTANVRLGD